MTHPCDRSAPLLLPDQVDVRQLSPRLQQMLAYLLAHEALLTQYPIGSIELHYNGPSVKPQVKLVL